MLNKKNIIQHFEEDRTAKGGLDLFKEVLWVSVGQRVAEVRTVKVGGQKKFCRSAWRGRSGFEPGRSAEFFFNLQL